MARTDNRRPWASFHGGHTAFGHARGTVAETAQLVADRGFLGFGFTEYFALPPCREFSPDGVTHPLAGRTEWLGAYVTAVREVQVAYSDQVSLVLGTELEYIRGAEAWTREQIRPWPFEYFVGSVHYVRYDGEDIAIDWDRGRITEALRRAGSPVRLYLDYYDHVLELLDWRLARVIGHLYLIKMLLEPAEQVDTPAIRAKVRGILETMRDRGARSPARRAGE